MNMEWEQNRLQNERTNKTAHSSRVADVPQHRPCAAAFEELWPQRRILTSRLLCRSAWQLLLALDAALRQSSRLGSGGRPGSSLGSGRGLGSCSSRPDSSLGSGCGLGSSGRLGSRPGSSLGSACGLCSGVQDWLQGRLLQMAKVFAPPLRGTLALEPSARLQQWMQQCHGTRRMQQGCCSCC